MRVLLSTLAILALTTPAFANEMNNDPEGSIQKSTSSAVQPSANEDTSASNLEPAAGDETVKETKTTKTVKSAEHPAKKVNHKQKVTKTTTEKHTEVDGTPAPTRATE